MADINDIYGGNFLKAETLKSQNLIGKELTIKSVKPEIIGDPEKNKPKLILSFEEINLKLVLNKTNAELIKELYGSDYSAWVGKKISLQITRRQFQGNLVPAIEVAII